MGPGQNFGEYRGGFFHKTLRQKFFRGGELLSFIFNSVKIEKDNWKHHHSHAATKNNAIMKESADINFHQFN